MLKHILVIVVALSPVYFSSCVSATQSCIGCDSTANLITFQNETNTGVLSETVKEAGKATKLTRADMNSFCALIITDLFEDAEAYFQSKGIELKYVYQEIHCGTYGTSLLSYVIKAANVRSFLMLRRYIINNLGNDAYVEFINVKSPFSSVSNECPLGVTKTMLNSNPRNPDMQKIQTLLIQYGAIEDC